MDAGIELGRSTDAEDALTASATMNPVTGKLGVTRKLDGQGHKTSRRRGFALMPLSWLPVMLGSPDDEQKLSQPGWTRLPACNT